MVDDAVLILGVEVVEVVVFTHQHRQHLGEGMKVVNPVSTFIKLYLFHF
jgi:beta-lactamase superfamily II metal-dependent hydrolase